MVSSLSCLGEWFFVMSLDQVIVHERSGPLPSSLQSLDFPIPVQRQTKNKSASQLRLKHGHMHQNCVADDQNYCLEQSLDVGNSYLRRLLCTNTGQSAT